MIVTVEKVKLNPCPAPHCKVVTQIVKSWFDNCEDLYFPLQIILCSFVSSVRCEECPIDEATAIRYVSDYLESTYLSIVMGAYGSSHGLYDDLMNFLYSSVDFGALASEYFNEAFNDVKEK